MIVAICPSAIVLARDDCPALTRKACSFHRRVTLSHFSGVVRMTSADARSLNDTEPFEALEEESLVSSASRIPSGANLAVQSSKVC